jgi:hypothetical protein
VLGTTFGKTREEIREISHNNFLHFKNSMRAQFPNFEFRMNGGIGKLMGPQKDPFDFVKAREIIDKDFHKLFLSDHGGIQEELWAHTYLTYSDYKYYCRNYLRAARFEAAAYKYAGGHNAHMHAYMDNAMHYTPDCIYIQTFSLLGGAHMDVATYGPLPGSKLDLGLYAARFAEYFWDPALRPLETIDEKFTADAEVEIWSNEAGWERDRADGTKEYVLSTVTIPEGYSTVKGIHLLDNAPEPAVRPLKVEVEGRTASFNIPGLKIFRVAVVEFGK